MGSVYILREQGANLFKIGRSMGCVEGGGNARSAGQAAGRGRSFVPFRTIHAADDVACEAMLHRLLSLQRVEVEGETDLFMVDPEVMQGHIRRAEALFHQLAELRDEVQDLSTRKAAGGQRKPEGLDHELRRRLLRLRHERRALDAQVEWLELKLKQRMGSAGEIAGVASWRPQTRRCFNEDIFRAREPELYQQTLEEFHCLDVKAWKRARPDHYRQIQTTHCDAQVSRVFRLVP